VNDRAALFASERAYLFSVAYRMLGSVAEAEDVLQEAFLRFAAADDGEVRSARAYLSTVVTRLCLDHLKSARVRREAYVGPWLPEPLLTSAEETPPPIPEDRVGLAESASMAVMLLLESLSPLERAVFLLREVFEYEFADIADTLDTSEAACRQLLSRARQHVVERRPRYRPTRAQQMRVAQSFLDAAQRGDVAGLARVLVEDVTSTSDGGGKVSAARKVVRGRDAVSRLMAGAALKAGPGAVFEVSWLNEAPALIVRAGGVVAAALIIDTDGERVRALYWVNNPEKLARLS
jgi:RNA polymerase sigma-70 factor (ECF subfamily)